MEGAVTIETSRLYISDGSVSIATTTESGPVAVTTMTSTGSGLYVSDGSHKSGNKSHDLSLWLPYFCIGLLLAILSLLSFWEYHRRNKHRYRGRKFKLSGLNKEQQKYKVTLNKNGSMPTPVDVKKIVFEHRPRVSTPDLAKSNRFAFIRNLYQKKASESEILRDIHVPKHSKEDLPEKQSMSQNNRSHVLFSDIQNLDNSSKSESGISENIGTSIDMLTYDDTYPVKIPPTPPRRNKHNINRFRDYYFYRVSLDQSSEKDEDSGYQSNFVPTINNTKHNEDTYQQNCDAEYNTAVPSPGNYHYYPRTMPSKNAGSGKQSLNGSYPSNILQNGGNLLELNAQNLLQCSPSPMPRDSAQLKASPPAIAGEPIMSATVLYNCREDGFIYLRNASWKETDL